MKDSSYLSSSV